MFLIDWEQIRLFKAHLDQPIANTFRYFLNLIVRDPHGKTDLQGSFKIPAC